MSYSSSRASSPPSPISKAALRSRSPPLAPLPSLSATLPGLTAFDRAVHVVNISNMTSQSYSDSHSPSGDAVEFTPEDQLLLYGAYKQATKGDVNTLKPAFFDISARSKWQAWANLRGKSKEEASEIYVNLVVKSLTRPASHPEHIMLADEILQRPSTPPPPLPILLQQRLDENEPEPVQDVASNPSNISDQHLHLPLTRKGSIALSTGVRSSAPSVYELASESLVDEEVEESTTGIDILHRELTETVVEEEIIDDDDDYAAEVQKATSSLSPPSSQSEDATRQTSEPVHTEQTADGTNNDEDDEVYQSSEEYDEDDSDESSITLAPVPSQQIKREVVPHQQVLVNADLGTRARVNRNHSREDDFVDEGVFEEEEKDEHVAQDQDLLGSIEVLDVPGEEKILAKSPISRNGSISSGYGGSVLSDKESTLSYRNTLDMLVSGQNKESKIGLTSPHVEPYRVNFMQDTSISPLDLSIHKDEHEQSRRNSSQHATDAPTRQDTPAVSSAPQPPVSVSASVVQSSQPSSPPSSSSPAATAPVDEPVCPVSKKTASSGGVCPAAMFAQARAAAAAAAAENGTSPATSAEAKESANSHTDGEASSSSSSHPTAIPRSASEPVHAPESESSAPSSTPTVTAPANPGKRLGQGIVNRFTALRSSLAAVSARASALSGGSSSTATVDPNAVVVKDPVTHQSVTVICPHLKSTRELETEVIRLQTEVSVLHERLDLLQESLKLKSESRKLEQRSVRGVLTMMLRQGLINAALLLIVFAILYKRRSPIAYAILAYIGHSKKEGEASWRAFLRWSADLVRTGQKNQQYVLRAGRRNGYW